MLCSLHHLVQDWLRKRGKNITVKHKMYIPFTMILIYIIIRLNTLQLAFKGNYPTII